MVGLVGATMSVAVTGQFGSRAWMCLSMAASLFFAMNGFHVCLSLYSEIRTLGSVCVIRRISNIYSSCSTACNYFVDHKPVA